MKRSLPFFLTVFIVLTAVRSTAVPFGHPHAQKRVIQDSQQYLDYSSGDCIDGGSGC